VATIGGDNRLRTGVQRDTAARLIVASGLIAATLGGMPFARAARPDAAFTVGILRRDAIVVPFASYDGRKWRTDWPEPRNDYDVPVNLASVPKGWWGPIGVRETWQAWVAKDPPRLLTVLQPDWFAAYCRRTIGLRTDYHPREPLPPQTVRPYPTDGLVVSPPQPIERVEIVADGDPRRSRLAPMILESFNRTEREISSEVHYPVPRAEREKVAPIIEAMYASPDGNVMYIEAAREYHQRADPSAACRAVAFGGGWFARGANTLYTPLQTYVTMLDCDRDGASYMLPLGIVRLADRTFWIAQFSGWDGAQYEVDEIKSKTVEPVVSRSGGGC
jgi:hypothetical protein